MLEQYHYTCTVKYRLNTHFTTNLHVNPYYAPFINKFPLTRPLFMGILFDATTCKKWNDYLPKTTCAMPLGNKKVKRVNSKKLYLSPYLNATCSTLTIFPIFFYPIKVNMKRNKTENFPQFREHQNLAQSLVVTYTATSFWLQGELLLCLCFHLC